MSATNVIARLRELRAKAYKGKWSVNGELGLEGERSSATDYDPLVLGGLKGGRGYIEYPHYSLYSQPTKTEGKANAAAIVAAMNSLPALLDAAEALEGLHDHTVEYVTLNNLHDADGSPAINNHWMKKARAALQALAEGGDQ